MATTSGDKECEERERGLGGSGVSDIVVAATWMPPTPVLSLKILRTYAGGLRVGVEDALTTTYISEINSTFLDI